MYVCMYVFSGDWIHYTNQISIIIYYLALNIHADSLAK